MRVVKMLVLSGVAALMCCFAAAGSASAATGPLWGFCHETLHGSFDAHCVGSSRSGEEYEPYLLQAGESLLLLALQLGSQTLHASGTASILCNKLHAHGYLEGGDPGKDGEKLAYSECTVPAVPNCDVNSQNQRSVNGIIETNQLTSELVYLTEKAAEKLEAFGTGTLFKPTSGRTFVELLLTALAGATCPVNTATGPLTITGEVIGENLFATLRLLLGTVTFPRTARTSYWLDTGSTPKKDSIKQIELGGVTATYLGEVSIDVALLGEFGDWLAFWVCP